MKYFMYMRRSTDDEKQALSIDAQREELDVRLGGLEIVEKIEEDASAFKPYNRPKFTKMMERLEKGEADGIIAWHPDRLSRNPIDGASIMYALDRGIIKDLKFGSYDFSNTPEGKLMLGFALAQSKYTSEKLGVDVMRGMQKKCRNGQKPSKAPPGYRNIRTVNRGNRYWEVDPERFEIVRKMWDLLLSGAYTVPSIHKKALEWGLTMQATRKMPERPISLATVYKIFTSIDYTGRFEWAGESYEGSHKPMISMEQFEKAQQILGKRGKYRTQKHSFPFTGCLNCGECASMITAELKQKRLKKTDGIATYTYYHCVGKKGPCSLRGCVREEDLTILLRPYVEGISVSPRLLNWVRTKLEKMTTEEQGKQHQKREEIRRKYENCMKAIQNLVSLYISANNADKSLLTDEELKKQKQALIVERDRYNRLLEENERNSDTAMHNTISIFDFSARCLEHFDNGSYDTKREILLTIGQNWKLFKGFVNREARFPFLRIQEGMEQQKALEERLEPKELALAKSRSTLSEGEVSIWWPRPGSNW